MQTQGWICFDHGDPLKPYVVSLFLIGASFCLPAKADRSHPFVRVACIPENGLLDIETRGLHDSVATKRGATPEGTNDALARGGFHRPNQLKLTCELGDVKYVIEANQGPQTQYLCGAVPDINLNVTRNGAPLLSNVTFGHSCAGRPSVMRITIGDGAQSWRGRETEVCYGRSDPADFRHCEWFFGADANFNKRFPIANADIERIVAPSMKK